MKKIVGFLVCIILIIITIIPTKGTILSFGTAVDGIQLIFAGIFNVGRNASGELLFGSLGATGFSQATANATIIARSAKIDLFILIYINLNLINLDVIFFNKFSFERQS